MISNLALINWDYYLGNHFQFFQGRNVTDVNLLSDRQRAELNRVFASYNICREIVDHYVNALVGKPFNWHILNARGKVCQKAESIFSDWLSWQDDYARDSASGSALANAVTQMLVCNSSEGVGSGYLRLYQPQMYQNLEPYKRVIVHCPHPDRIEVKRDCSGIAYQIDYYYGNGELETYTFQPDGSTLIENFRSKWVDYFCGRMPVIELRGRSLITDAIKKSQNAINRTLTYKNISIESSGFLERILLNAQPPGEWNTDPETGEAKFTPDKQPVEIGAGVTSFVSGLPIGNPQNPKKYTNPQVSYKPPTSVKMFRDNLKMLVHQVYSQAGLTYLVESDKANISGVSRQMLRDDFILRLKPYKLIIEQGLKRTFEIVIDNLSPHYPELKGCKPVVELNLLVKQSISERVENNKDVQTGLISIPTAIARNGLDVEKELDLIREYAHLVQYF